MSDEEEEEEEEFFDHYKNDLKRHARGVSKELSRPLPCLLIGL